MSVRPRPLRSEPLEDRRLLTIIVDTLVDESDGDFSDGDLSLREAIEQSNVHPDADTISFDAALGGGTILLTAGELAISESVVIDATALAGGLTVDASGNDIAPDIDNGHGSRVFYIDDGDEEASIDVELHGLTLTGGDVAGEGGAIWASENLVLADMTIVHNAARESGGGVYASSSDGEVNAISIIRSVLSHNTSQDSGGGARLSVSSGELIIADSHFTDNTANSGGGLYVRPSSSQVAIVRSTFLRNEAVDFAGGIFFGGGRESQIQISESTFDDNHALARFGGGILVVGFSNSTDFVSNNNTISNNSAALDGGGLWIQFAASASIISTTISGNQAGERGGGVWAQTPLVVQHSTITGNTADYDNTGDGYGGGFAIRSYDNSQLDHTIVADNRRGNGLHDDVTGVVDPTSSYNFIGVDQGLFGISDGVNGNQVGSTGAPINPLLGPLADNGGPTETHLPQLKSLVVDAGDPGFLPPPEFDQRGEPFARVSYDVIDIGAVERQQRIVDTLVDESDGDYSPGDFSLREAIELSNTQAGGEVITFAPHLDGGTILLTLGELAITDSVVIDARPLATGLTVDAAGNDPTPDDNNADGSRVLNITDGFTFNVIDVEVHGLTLTGGDAEDGGAIYTEERTILNELFIHDNAAEDGGGIYSQVRTLTTTSILNSRIVENVGGGLFVNTPHNHLPTPFADGSTIIAGTTVADNFGPGIEARLDSEVEMRIVDSTIHGNTGVGIDARIDIVSTLLIDRSEITDNGRGGIDATLYIQSSLTITDSDVTGNFGPGVDADVKQGSTTTIVHSLLEGNGTAIDLILEPESVADVFDTTITGNIGTGIRLQQRGRSTATIQRVTVENNAYGGIVVETKADDVTTIRDSQIVDNMNEHGSGGGLNAHIDGGSFAIIDTAVRNNHAQRGGGVHLTINRDAHIDVTGTTISGNTADDSGGGAYIEVHGSGWVDIASSTISGNTAGQRGGGLHARSNHPASIQVSHTTIVDNELNQDGHSLSGGGISVEFGLNDAFTLDHTIVADNLGAGGVASDIYGEIGASSSYNLVGVDTDLVGISDGVSGNQIGTAATPIDPLLEPLADNGGPTLTHALSVISPALDAGDPSFVPPPASDQRGYYRVVDGDGDMTARIDIGAVEFDSVAPLAGDGNLDGVVDGVDYITWAMHFGDNPALVPPGSPANGDYNGDGVVDGNDYNVWAGNYGTSVAAPATRQSVTVQATREVSQSATSRADAVDAALEDSYDIGVTVADDPAMRDWQLSRAFDSVLKKRDIKSK